MTGFGMTTVVGHRPNRSPVVRDVVSVLPGDKVGALRPGVGGCKPGLIVQPGVPP